MSLSVLVTDDSRFARKQVIRALPEALNAEVRQATNGEEALEAFRAQAPDLMFLDLTMPNLDGFQVLEKLGQEVESFRVIVISADVQPKAVARVQELGALDFIKKPVDAEELTSVLKKHGFL